MWVGVPAKRTRPSFEAHKPHRNLEACKGGPEMGLPFLRDGGVKRDPMRETTKKPLTNGRRPVMLAV